jgi:hypothetical protein
MPSPASPLAMARMAKLGPPRKGPTDGITCRIFIPLQKTCGSTPGLESLVKYWRRSLKWNLLLLLRFLMRIPSSVFRAIPVQMRGKDTAGSSGFVSNGASRHLSGSRKGIGMLIPNLPDPVGLSLWMDGAYEPQTPQLLKRHVSSDAVFVDVGANIGAFHVVPTPVSARSLDAILLERVSAMKVDIVKDLKPTFFWAQELLIGAGCTFWTMPD